MFLIKTRSPRILISLCALIAISNERLLANELVDADAAEFSEAAETNETVEATETPEEASAEDQDSEAATVEAVASDEPAVATHTTDEESVYNKNVNAAEYMRELAALGFDEHTPRFRSFKDKSGMFLQDFDSATNWDVFLNGNPYKEKSLSVAKDFHLKPDEVVAEWGGNILLDEQSEKTISNLTAAIRWAPKDRRAETLTSRRIVFWSRAVPTTLLYISHYAADVGQRHAAASALIKNLLMTGIRGQSEIIRMIAMRMYSTCDSLDSCADLLNEIISISVPLSDVIVSDEFTSSLYSSVKAVSKNEAFFAALFDYQYSLIRLNAKFYHYTGLHRPEFRGTTPSLDLLQLAELNRDAEQLVGDNSYLAKAISIAKARFISTRDSRLAAYKTELSKVEATIECFKALEMYIDSRPDFEFMIDKLAGEHAAKIKTEVKSLIPKPGEYFDKEKVEEFVFELINRYGFLKLKIEWMEDKNAEMSDFDLLKDTLEQQYTLFKNEVLKKQFAANADGSFGFSAEYLKKVKLTPAQEEKLKANLQTSLNRIAPDISALAFQVTQNIYINYYRTLGLKQYFSRLRSVNPMPFLQAINTLIDEDFPSKSTALDSLPVGAEAGSLFFALTQFAVAELALPYRAEWMNTTVKLATYMAKKISEENKSEHLRDAGQEAIYTHFIQPELLGATVAGLGEILNYYNNAIDQFIEAYRVTQFLVSDKAGAINSKINVLEREAMRLPGFESLIHQRLNIENASLAFNDEWSRFSNATDGDVREQILRSIPLRERDYVQARVTVACYGYWLPMSNGTTVAAISDLEALRDVELINSKLPLQWDLQILDGKGQLFKQIDLRKACGNDPSAVATMVTKYLSYDYSKYETDSAIGATAKQVMTYLGPIPLIYASSWATGKVGGAVKGFIVNRTAPSSVTPVVANATLMARITAGALVAARTSSKFLATAAFDLVMYTFVSKAIYAAVYNFQKVPYAGRLVDWLPARPFWESNYNASFVGNLWHNFGRELVTGFPVFVMAPLARGLALHQIRKVSIFGYRKGVERTTQDIELYVASGGFKDYRMINGASVGTKNPAGMTRLESFSYTALPLIYQTALFTGSPMLGRLILKSLGEDQLVWMGVGQLQRDFAQAAILGMAFAAMRRMRLDPSYKRIIHDAKMENKLREPNGLYKILDLKPSASSQQIQARLQQHNKDAQSPKADDIRIQKEGVAISTLLNPRLKSAYDANGGKLVE